MAKIGFSKILITDPEFAIHQLHPLDRCFLCGDHLPSVEVVYWHGSDEKGQEIWLHPDCAVKLGSHLIKDGLVKKMPDGKIAGLII